MSAPRLRRSIALVVSLLVVLACGDYSRSTSPPAVPQKLLPPTLVVTSPFTVVPRGSMAQAVRWGSAHQNVDESVSVLIGPEGGTVSLPGADFSMTVPAGALLKPTTIKVVARSGAYVVYDMLPHGLKFLQPVTVVQGLSTTASYGTAAGNSVRSAYLPEGKEQIRHDFAAPSELQRAKMYFYGAQPIAETQEWILNHFSRYILISGVWTEVPDEDSGGLGGDDGGRASDGGDQAVESIGAGNLPLQLPLDSFLPDTTEGPNAP